MIQILAIDLGTEMVPSIALGAEKPEPDVMTRSPRSRNERLLTWGSLARSYLFLGLIEAIAALTGYYFVLKSGGWSYGMSLSQVDPLYLKATSITFAAIVVAQMANGLTCRSAKESLSKIGILTNKYLLIGIVLEILLVLAIIYTPPLQHIIGTTALTLVDWLILLPFTLLIFGADELRKLMVRTIHRSKNINP